MTLSRNDAMGIAKEVAMAMQRLPKLIEKYGPDQPDGTVIRFTKSFYHVRGWDAFPANAQRKIELADAATYIYAAVRANGKWYTTGPKSEQGYEWEQLIDWLDEGQPVDIIEIWPYNLQGRIEEVDQPDAEVVPNERIEDWDPDLTKAAAQPEQKRAHRS